MKLDLFKLHFPEDNRDERCWILASGGNLNKLLREIKREVLLKIDEKELINKLLFKLKINIRSSEFEDPRKLFSIWIKNRREGLNLYKKDLCKLTGTSGGDWEKIEQGRFLPSCQKLRKITKILGKHPQFKFDCKGGDFCLRKLDNILASLKFNQESTPLVIISELLIIWKQTLDKTKKEFGQKKWEILENIEWLKLNQHESPTLKAVKHITKDLSKIIGAFAADGNFYPPDMIRWEEEYKDNMNSLSKWLFNTFGIRVKLEKSKRDRNSWLFKFRNKIISRYFEVFFGFKPGKKAYIVDEPQIIKKCPLEIRKEFAKGALMFDSGVNTEFTVSFYSVSKNFRDSVAEIIKNDLEIMESQSANRDKLWGIVININHQNRQILEYFEEETTKWQRLDEFINGFNHSVKNLEEAKIILDCTYRKLRHNPFSEILDAVKNKNGFDLYELLDELNTSRASLQRRIRLLIHANILTKKRKRKNIYNFNKNINEWRLPNTNQVFA